ncbi:MAG: site-specific integrase, partial [Acidimicrobiales bacterium]
MSRRGRGEGSVYRDGNAWVARIDLPLGPDGKRRQRKRKMRTKSEAHKALRELQSQVDQMLDHDRAKRTVADAVDEYLRVQPNDRAPKTIEMERWRGSIVVAGLGRRQLGKLSVKDCDAFLELAASGEYGRRPLGPEAVRRVRRLLVNVIRNEMRTGSIGRNVADLSVLPNHEVSTDVDNDDDGDSSTSLRRTLTYDEFRALWQIARSPLIVLIDLCGRNGLRPSEARSLRWERVDLDGLTITVNRQMSSENTPTKAKTRRSVRTIRIDDRTASTLSTWRSEQDQKRTRAANRWKDHGLVVTTRYGTGIGARNLRRMVAKACEEAGVERIVPYELRHTAITFQIDAGHDTWQVADWAGTSERMIEMVYRHRLTRVAQLG